ncbi:MAG: hypothetical protein II540_02235 [Paludibacteraceae bacterium]|nr:hypothetical protein [Paludibacteraceae bacterium]
MPNKIQFCVDTEGLPVAVGSDSGLTSEAQDKEKQGGGFNSEYVGADGQQQLFDEVPVRLVLLAPFKGGNVRTKERWGDLSNAGRHPAQKKKRPRGANRRRKPDRDVTYMSVMVAKWSRV